jgi:hypothetical protein
LYINVCSIIEPFSTMPSTSSSPDELRFGTDAAQAIFRRAAEHQEVAQAAARADADGLSLAELQAIGAEAGIDPAYIAAAAAEFSTPEPKDDTPWWYAGPNKIETECVVPGTITDGPVWASIVHELRSTFDTDGVATQLANTLEWSFMTQSGESTRVTVAPGPHGTRIRVVQSMRNAAQVGPSLGGSFGVMGLILGTLVAIGDVEPTITGLAVILVVLSLVCIGAGIPVYRAYAQRQQRRLDGLMDRLELIALKEAPRSSSTATSAHSSSAASSPPGETVNQNASSGEVPDRSDRQRTQS